MVLRSRKVLGLVIEEHAIVAAEVRVSGQKAEVRHAAEFTYPQGVALDDPQHLGPALREFLRRSRFSARNAVIGVPARWLLSKEKVFPPAAPESLAGMVRIEAERSFATDLDHLMMDYANGPAAGTGPRLLMVGMPRARGDQLVALSAAAGLKAKAIVPGSMALAVALLPPSASGLMLSLRPGHVEFCVRAAGRFVAIRHVPVTAPVKTDAAGKGSVAWGSALADEIRRLSALLPHEEEDTVPESLVIWDGMGLDPHAFRGLGAALSVEVRSSGGLPELGIAPASCAQVADGHRFVAAAALALAGARGKGFPVDLLHSRLAARTRIRPGRRIALTAAACVIALAAAGALLAGLHAQERDLAELQRRLAAMKPDIEAARSLVQQAALARGWADGRPRFLDALRELTLAFPAEGRIWVGSLAMREDMQMVVSGKADDEQAVLDILDQIRAKPTFSSVKLVYLRDAGGNSHQVAYSMTFAFVNTE